MELVQYRQMKSVVSVPNSHKIVPYSRHRAQQTLIKQSLNFTNSQIMK